MILIASRFDFCTTLVQTFMVTPISGPQPNERAISRIVRSVCPADCGQGAR